MIHKLNVFPLWGASDLEHFLMPVYGEITNLTLPYQPSPQPAIRSNPGQRTREHTHTHHKYPLPKPIHPNFSTKRKRRAKPDSKTLDRMNMTIV